MAAVTWGNRIKAEKLLRNSMWRVQTVKTERLGLYFSFVFYFLFIRRVFSELSTMLKSLPVQSHPILQG